MIRVRFYSQLRDVAPDLEREVPAGTTVEALLAELYREHPALEKWDPHIRVAAGLEWVGRDHVLRDDNEISIMPPVQGG